MRTVWQQTKWHDEGNRHFPRTRIKIRLCCHDVSRNSSVSVVARLRAGRPRNRVSIPGKDNRFFSSLNRQDPLRDLTSFLLNGNLRVKRPGREADLLVLSRSCYFTRPYTFMAAHKGVFASLGMIFVSRFSVPSGDVCNSAVLSGSCTCACNLCGVFPPVLTVTKRSFCV